MADKRFRVERDKMYGFYIDNVRLPQNYDWFELAFMYFYPDLIKMVESFGYIPNGNKEVLFIRKLRKRCIESIDPLFFIRVRRFRDAVSRVMIEEIEESLSCPFKPIMDSVKDGV